MSQKTDTDIRELKDLITGLREEVRIGFTAVNGRIDMTNTRISNVESNTQKIPDLAEKVGELKNWKQIAIIVFTSSVSGAIAWFVRGGVS